ncbi:MAG: Stp1/IreP family PP2C-type Ser/Thr phosphatase [bacterium]
MPLKLQIAGKTDVGLVRSGNEDYLYLDKQHDVYAVCDGMGGHQAGEVASMTAAQILESCFANIHEELLADPDLSLGQSFPRSGELLVKAVRLANRAIYNLAAADPTKSGMGTTVVAVAPEEDYLSIVHVGDSRAYRLDEKRLTPLTTDHSWVTEMRKEHAVSEEEALTMVGKNVITRALGVKDTVEVDYRLIKIEPNQTFILCSDGLCGFATDQEIFDIADRARGSIDHITNDLIQAANDRGGSDNVTVVVLRTLDVGRSNYSAIDAVTLPAEDKQQLAAEDGWVKRINDAIAQVDTIIGRSDVDSGGGRRWLLLIFALFVAVAVVLVFWSSQR